MANGTALRQAIDKSGMKQQAIAERLGLSRAGLSLKLDGKNEFKASEIKTLTDILKLSDGECMSIFFQ